MDRNHRNQVVLIGDVVSVAERAVGQSGRTLVEARVAVMRPGRKGEGEARDVIPVVVWDGATGAALTALAPGTALVILGRVSAREWTAPTGQTRTFVEIVAEHVTVDVAAAPGAVRAAAPAGRPIARAAPRASADDSVPF
jgi:single-stranded DNA-binding protein